MPGRISTSERGYPPTGVYRSSLPGQYGWVKGIVLSKERSCGAKLQSTKQPMSMDHRMAEPRLGNNTANTPSTTRCRRSSVKYLQTHQHSPRSPGAFTLPLDLFQVLIKTQCHQQDMSRGPSDDLDRRENRHDLGKRCLGSTAPLLSYNWLL
jgi:hypothetical protein